MKLARRLRALPVAALVAASLAALGSGDLSTSAAGRAARETGYRILLWSNRDGKWRVYSVRSDGLGLTPLLRRGRALTLWSRSGDGGTLAFVDRRGAIYVSRASGAGLRRVVARGAGPVLSRDGKLLAFSSRGRIWAVRTDGRGLRRVPSGPDDELSDWSPDGKALLFSTCTGDCEYAAIAVQPLHGRRRVVARGDSDLGGTWSPDGRWIAYRRPASEAEQIWSLWLVRPDGSGRHRISSDFDVFAWSPDGRRLAVTSGPDVAVVGVDGKRVGRVPLRGLRSVEWLSWSPDAGELILQAPSGDDPDEIWTVGIAGGGLRRLTSEGTSGLVGWTRLAPVLREAAPVPASERVLGSDLLATRTPVLDLSADAGRVAFVARTTRMDCQHVTIWTPQTRGIQRFRVRAACSGGGRPGVYEVELAGTRVAWGWDRGERCWIELKSATLADPLPRVVAARTCKFAAYHLHGDGGLLVFNDGERLVRIGAGRQQCERKGPVARMCAEIESDAEVGSVESVSAGLIAARGSRDVVVVDRKGDLVRAFSFGAVGAARLDGDRLVVTRSGAVEAYDVATGARMLQRPLPSGYALADADGGIAVLRRDRTILLLRLADSRSLTLTPGRGPVLTDLESPGLYYSYATGDGGGRVVFVPRAELERRLAEGAR
jgi:hypothetical protein